MHTREPVAPRGQRPTAVLTPMPEVGKLLVVVGLALVAIGTVVWLAPTLPSWGRLPGDIHVDRPGFSFRFPIILPLINGYLIRKPAQ